MNYALFFVGMGVALAEIPEFGETQIQVERTKVTISKEPSFTGKVLSAWVEDLKNEDPQIRQKALTALAMIGPLAKPAKPVLEQLLKDEDPTIRLKSAVTLWKVDRHSPAVVPALCGFLKDMDGKIRVQALQSLGQMGPDAGEAAPLLIDLVKDKDEGVRTQASQALMAIGRYAVPTMIKGLKHPDKAVRRQSAEMLGKIGYLADDAVPFLKEALQDEDKLTRFKAAAALWKIQGDIDFVLPLWLDGIKDADSSVRKEILDTVLFQVQPRPRAALPIFHAGLKEEDLLLQVKAAECIWDVTRTPENVLPVLLEALKTGPEPAWGTAVQLAGRMGAQARAAIPTLVDLLVRPGRLSTAIVHSLAQMGPPVIPAITALFKENNPQIDILAGQLLGQMGKEAVAPLLNELPKATAKRRAVILTALGQMGPEAKEALPALLEELKADKSESNRLAIVALGHIGAEAKAAVPLLLEKVQGSDAPLRTEAIRAMMEIDPDGNALRPIMSDFLNDSQNSRRLVGARWLWEKDRETKKTLPILIGLLKDKTARNQTMALLAGMGSDAKDAVPALVKLANDPNGTVAQQAVATVMAIQPEAKDIIPVLMAHVDDKDYVWRMAAAADLKKIHTETAKAAAALVEMIPGAQPVFRAAVAKNLAGFGKEATGAVPMLLELLNETTIKQRIPIAEALGEIDPEQLPKAVAALEEVMKNHNPITGNLAALSLWKIDPKNPQVMAFLQKNKQINHPAVRASTYATIKAMGPAGKEAIPLLNDGLADTNPDVRLEAAEALWAVIGPSPKIVPVLLELLRDPETDRLHDRIVKLLGNMGAEAKAALPPLLAIRNNKLWSKRQSAAQAIKKIDPGVATREGIH